MYPKIKNAMGRVEFADNNWLHVSESIDKFHLWLVIDALINKFQSVPLKHCISLNKQSCEKKAQHHPKQCLPAKPHKLGNNLWILSDIDGFACNLKNCTSNENVHTLPYCPHLQEKNWALLYRDLIDNSNAE